MATPIIGFPSSSNHCPTLGASELHDIFRHVADHGMRTLPDAFYERIGGLQTVELASEADYWQAIIDVPDKRDNAFTLGFLWGSYTQRYSADLEFDKRWPARPAAQRRLAGQVLRIIRPRARAVDKHPFFDLDTYGVKLKDELLALCAAPSEFARGLPVGSFFAGCQPAG